MDKEVIKKGLDSHDQALHIKDGWIRDPYIILAPDGYYYLTGTTPLPSDPRRINHKYNILELKIKIMHVLDWKKFRSLIDKGFR